MVEFVLSVVVEFVKLKVVVEFENVVLVELEAVVWEVVVFVRVERSDVVLLVVETDEVVEGDVVLDEGVELANVKEVVLVPLPSCRAVISAPPAWLPEVRAE